METDSPPPVPPEDENSDKFVPVGKGLELTDEELDELAEITPEDIGDAMADAASVDVQLDALLNATEVENAEPD
jgi:hypothetical protein